MNKLAAVAAVAPISVDDGGAEADPVLEDTPGAAATDDVPVPAFEAADADKEDDGDFPGTREQRAANSGHKPLQYKAWKAQMIPGAQLLAEKLDPCRL